MIKEFKQFLLRGNVIDLAVGVVVGVAFGSVVNSIVSDLFTPFISAVIQLPDFSNLIYIVNGSEFKVGNFLNTLISFIVSAAAIFFFVVKPVNVLVARSRREPPVDPTTKKCPECLSEIPIQAKRCAHCTQVLQ